MHIHYALVKHGVGQIVYQHLYADVGRARVLLLLASGILLFPLGLALAVGQVTLADVFHYIVDGLLDRALTYRLPTHQQIHKRGLMLHVVPVAKLHSVQVCSQRGEHGTGHGGLVVPGHILSQ